MRYKDIQIGQTVYVKGQPYKVISKKMDACICEAPDGDKRRFVLVDIRKAP